MLIVFWFFGKNIRRVTGKWKLSQVQKYWSRCLEYESLRFNSLVVLAVIMNYEIWIFPPVETWYPQGLYYKFNLRVNVYYYECMWSDYAHVRSITSRFPLRSKAKARVSEKLTLQNPAILSLLKSNRSGWWQTSQTLVSLGLRYVSTNSPDDVIIIAANILDFW
jgi:hypothetical protein